MLIALVGCARTGLEVSDEPAPVSVPPCLWSLGEPFEVARGGSLGEPVGSLHPVRDRVVVGELGGSAVMLTAERRPEELFVLPPLVGPIFTGELGWATTELPRPLEESCGVHVVDEDFAPVWGSTYETSTCRVFQTELGWVELAMDLRYSGPVLFARRADNRGGALLEGRMPLPTDRGLPDALARDLAGHVVMAWATPDGTLVQRTLTPGDEARPAARGPASLALDRVSGAMILLVSEPGAPRLYRVPLEGLLTLTELLGPADFPAPPAGRVATNETETLVPLADGTMLALPHGSGRAEPVFTEPVAPSVDRMELVLRPATSVGGLLYERTEGGERVLHYQPLVCNR